MPDIIKAKKAATPRVSTAKSAEPKVTKPRASRAKAKVEKVEDSAPEEEEYKSLMDQFVFMDKAKDILDVGLKTGKNIILFGPGGHGKSELTAEFLYEKGINPFVITMGKGTTTDRLFGGIDIPTLEKSGKIEYLVENSFMNYPFVIMEEMMDANPYILEQLKDILSSGYFRNGTQVFKIKTQFIVCCTNRTRAEFSKNDSLKALMERFPLELNVIWDNYNEASYNTLLEKRFGVGRIDPIIPFLLQEFHKNGITISPRIAIDAYDIFQECGPDALPFIAEFAKKPALISETLKKFESTISFKKIGSEIEVLIRSLGANDIRTKEQKEDFVATYKALDAKLVEVKKVVVTDDFASMHTNLVKITNAHLNDNLDKRNKAAEQLKSLR